MIRTHSRMAVAGGLVLLLLTSACASKSHTRTTANPSPRDRAVASERSMDNPAVASDRSTYSEGRMAARDQKAEQGRVAMESSADRPLTERPVPSNRTGSGDPIAGDQVVPCADQRGDMTAPLNCAPRTRPDDRAAADRRTDRTAYTAEVLSACRHRIDTNDHVIFDDPACPTRYRPQMGSSYENVDYSRESAYFDRYMDKAVKHAREAEIAANQGHAAEMLRHSELSLDFAKEAQRAGNVPGLVDGIGELRETLRHGQGTQWQDAADHVRHARIRLSEAAGIKPRDTRLGGPVATSAGMKNRTVRTVRGELIGDEAATRSDGTRQYVLRDRSGQDTPIMLSPDMSQRVKAGDTVKADLDSDGRVVAINRE